MLLPGGKRQRASAADLALSDHFGEEVELGPEADVAHQDAGQVSLVGTATLRELAALHGLDRPLDPRHLRANLVLETAEPFVEERTGRELSIGGVRLAVTERIERCRMVDVQQADVPAAPDLLKTIAAHRGCAPASTPTSSNRARFPEGTRCWSSRSATSLGWPRAHAERGARRRHGPRARGGGLLHLLVGDWRLLSDLSFADLVLWVPAGWRAGWRSPTSGRRPGRWCSSRTSWAGAATAAGRRCSTRRMPGGASCAPRTQLPR